MRAKRKRRSRLAGALILLLLLLLLLPLGSLLPGFLPGGKSRAEPVPEQAPEEAGTLEITVVREEDLSPVKGALVFAEKLSGGETQERSDDSGRVKLRGLGDGPVRVEATVDGRKVEAWVDPSLQREVQLAVGAEPRRTGRVKPKRAHVVLLARDGSEIASTDTDEEGRYDLPLRPGSVCAVADGFAPEVAQEGDLELREGALVVGKLIGGGAGDLTVVGLVPAPGTDDGMLPYRARWRVEADGTFRGRVPKGAPAFGSFDGLPFRIEAGEIRLPTRTRAKGTVKRTDGSPAAHAALLFRALLDGDFETPLPGLKVDADERGQFDVAGFAAVRYSVEAYAPGCATRVVSDVKPADGPFTIVLDPGFTIAGSVVDVAGLPVLGAQIRAVGVPEEPGRPVLLATADEQGRFRVAGLGGTHARARVTAPGYHATTLDLLTPSSSLRVILQVNR